MYLWRDRGRTFFICVCTMSEDKGAFLSSAVPNLRITPCLRISTTAGEGDRVQCTVASQHGFALHASVITVWAGEGDGVYTPA